MKKWIILISFVMLCFSVSANAAKYKIVFTEGHHTFNYSLPMSNLENKYMAKIQLYVDDVLILDDIRGSTLSDSIFYYQLWHDGIKDRAPTDEDIIGIFNTWDSQIEGVSVDRNIDAFLKDMNEIIKFIGSIPVVWSGRYTFNIGLHKGGNSVHGHPYVPRLAGTWDKQKPYNAKEDGLTDEELVNLSGVWLATINKNKSHSMNKVAAGINIHDGRRSLDYKDSEGCLTIHPDDWDRFIKEFPSIQDWKDNAHTGEVVVIREKPIVSPPMPPSSIMVNIMEFFGIGNESE